MNFKDYLESILDQPIDYVIKLKEESDQYKTLAAWYQDQMGKLDIDMSENCIFCKIVKGEIPSIKLIESTNILSFMDISPLSDGHSLFIPKQHAEKMHQIDNDVLGELMVAIKKVAKAGDFES